jgi:feruloyl esterase
MRGGLYALADAALTVFVHDNDPAFASRRIISYRTDKATGAFHAVVRRAEANLVKSKLRKGIGHFPENFDTFIRQDRKLLIWHNLSDDKLPPFTSFALYKQLAARHGGYGKLGNNIRLFGLPGTPHCSGGGKPGGPGSFDAIAAMEAWVERGIGPNGLIATLYEPTPLGSVDFTKPLGRTMPLCMFPQMARYKGSGDVNDAANWECKAGDTRMLKVGESGRRAGVLK